MSVALSVKIHLMKYTASLLFFLFVTSYGFAQPRASYKMISTDNYAASKNCYLLTLFEEIPALNHFLKEDSILTRIGRDKKNQLLAAIKNCGNTVSCYTDAAKFTPAEIKEVGGRLVALYQPENELGELVKDQLIPSGCYYLYAAMDHKQLLLKAWEQDARCVNHMIDVYAAGKKPNYAKIDSISFNVLDRGYPELLAMNASLSVNTHNGNSFYASPLSFALTSLDINERYQAADYEPLNETENKSALAYAKKVDWDNFKYTLILVPGEGPEEAGVALSAGGMLRCRLAVLQYKNGLAPFIMVSGGCVHPFKTKYNEAIEMKKYLMQTLHIPEKVILIEPHARHTTTNLRNCARIIFRNGFPMDKPCITSTAKSQSYYITSIMPSRCEQELGYLPYKNGKRLSDHEAEFYPLAAALQIDFDEPMDP